MPITSAFSTLIYQEKLTSKTSATTKLNKRLLIECEDLAVLDKAGVAWSKQNYANGFTSYASVNRMQTVSPTFADLENLLLPHLKIFVAKLHLNLNASDLKMSTCWVNIMKKQTAHSMHIHPLSVISGTYYVSTPPNCSALRFEDPRYSFFMARPPLKKTAPKDQHTQFTYPTKAGQVVLFESFVKHEVPPNHSREPRVSISFNFDWA